MSLGYIGKPSSIAQDGSAPRVSDDMTEEDFLRLTRRTQTIGTMAGFGSGAALTFLASKLIGPRPTRRNTLFLTFLSSSFVCSMLTSHFVLTNWLHNARAKLRSPPTNIDPDLASWRETEKQTRHGLESGVAGMEAFPDKYATTRGDH